MKGNSLRGGGQLCEGLLAGGLLTRINGSVSTMRRVCSQGLPINVRLFVAIALLFPVGQGHRQSWALDAVMPARPAGHATLVVAAEPITLDRLRVPAGCVLIADTAVSPPDGVSIHVHSLAGQSLEVLRVKLVSLQASRPTAALHRGLGATADKEVPALSRRQPQVVQNAWRQIAAAIAENERLSRPRPEPLFARAELWMMVGNYDAALRDLLGAMRIASDTEASPRVYDVVFHRLLDVLERYDVMPAPPQDGEPSRHYGHGMHSFWAGDYLEADKAFTNAISLASNNPLYWYMRAATRRRLGSEDAAKHDALLGAAAERKACLLREGVSVDINRELRRLQGNDRIWLENHRRGDPVRRTMSGMKN